MTFLQLLLKNKQKYFQVRQTHLSYQSSENNNTIFLSLTLPTDIENLVRSMKTSKASVPNSILTKFLELLKREFPKLLSDVINLSFNQGVFPNVLKIENVILHLKKT